MFADEVDNATAYIDLFKPKNNTPYEVQHLIDRECIDTVPPIKLYEPQAVLVNKIDRDEVLDTLSFAGRMAWQKDWNRDPELFVKNIIKMGHESVIEHVTFNFTILCDRATSHEIVRHRVGTSFTQLSQRYVSYGDVSEPVPVVVSPDWDKDEMYLITDAAITAISEYRGAVQFANIKPEIARQVLPNALGTILVVSFNPRSLRHFLSLRMAKGAYSPIRCIANEIYDIMIDSDLELFVEEYRQLRIYDPRIKVEEEE
jgi:thymidylate synthase (FAD)